MIDDSDFFDFPEVVAGICIEVSWRARDLERKKLVHRISLTLT